MQVLYSVGGSLPLTLAAFFGVLMVVVFVHELGHFLVGRWCGVGVQAFSIGFGPELIGFTDRHGTRWKLAAIPLGGYVKFVGDVNGASVPDPAQLAQMSERERTLSFHHKPLWRRAAIVAAGPIANFILAILIFGGVVYANGRQVIPPKVIEVVADSPAARAGFQVGDVVMTIDGNRIESFSALQRYVSARPETPLQIMVERDGAEVALAATPELREMKTRFGTHRAAVLGLKASSSPADVYQEHYGFLRSMAIGAAETWFVIERSVDMIGRLATGRESMEALSGPVGIAYVSGVVAREVGLIGLINLAAMLSAGIGLFNLFPIPLLDGGHLLFYGIEAVRGRPLSERAQEIGFRIGFAMVVSLMLFTTWNDIWARIAAFGT